jgi:hypothetical protein
VFVALTAVSMFPKGLFPWTLSALVSGQPRDPINVLAANHDVPETLTLLSAVGMRKTGRLEQFAERQWFDYEPIGPHASDESVATARQWLERGERIHARVYSPGPIGAVPDLGRYTALTAHLDRGTWNPHCWVGLTAETSASFTKSREELASRIRMLPLPVRDIRTRNVGSVRQCDGTRVVADGRVVIIG